MPCSASSATRCRCASPPSRRRVSSPRSSGAEAMGIFDFLSPRNKNTASVARDRLRILIQQERSLRGAPDYLPLLQRELLEVIRKYVNVDVDAVKVDLIKDGDN